MGKKSVNELMRERNEKMTQREACDIRMNEIVDKAAAEKRELNADEKAAYVREESAFKKLSRELVMLNDAIAAENNKREDKKSKNQLLRESLNRVMERGGKAEFTLQREFTGIDTAAIEAGGMVPLTIKEVLPPLEMGLVFDKVGIPVQTGVTGNLQWPVMGTIEASILGEHVALSDSKIDLSKINAKHVRMGITIPLSSQAIMDANNDIEAIVKTQLMQGVTRTLNRVMFSRENFTSDLHGPFAGAKTTGVFAGAIPTFAELMAMKGKVAAEGVDMAGFCFVMSENMKATLEATPKDAGSGRMIIENGTIAGYPVFCTEFVNYGADKSKDSVEHIVAGAFAYIAVNQHGAVRLVVDPYSRAKEDIVQITLNADWSMTTLRTEAFASYKCKG